MDRQGIGNSPDRSAKRSSIGKLSGVRSRFTARRKLKLRFALLQAKSGVRIPQPRSDPRANAAVMEDEFAMRRVRWITLVWPGLTDLWLFGGWWGLAIACSFAWLANLAIVSSFVWTDWIGAWSRAGVWVLLAVSWTASVVLSFRQLRGNQAVLAEGDCRGLVSPRPTRILTWELGTGRTIVIAVNQPERRRCRLD